MRHLVRWEPASDAGWHVTRLLNGSSEELFSLHEFTHVLRSVSSIDKLVMVKRSWYHLKVLVLAVFVPAQGLHHYVCHVLAVLNVLLSLMERHFVKSRTLVDSVLHLKERSLFDADVRHPGSNVDVSRDRELI